MNLITHNLLDTLQQLNKEAQEIRWITAFAMKSGVTIMLDSLKEAHDRGANIQLLVGDYLCITQPDALQLLHDTLPRAEIRLYQAHGRSFHPKAYVYRHAQEQHVIVGSSNLSNSALTTGIEWSLHTVNLETYEEASEQFLTLFYDPNTVPIHTLSIENYRHVYDETKRAMPLTKKWSAVEATQLMYDYTEHSEMITESNIADEPLTPRPAQQLALQSLQETFEQGYDKAMAILATGLGKTYLAAFFARNFKRVLFVAHREEILEQAKQAFQHVHPEKTVGFYNKLKKDTNSDMLFASIYTLSQSHHLEKFNRDAFDLIVIDEFHHAAAPTYHRLLEYFEPSFLLGITATPDRLDNKDVYELCDGNIAIDIHFIEAISKNWLAPFHYYAIKDTIDYSQIRLVGMQYDEEELTYQQLQQPILEHIFTKWIELKQTRTIAFCSSIAQANYMADYFRKRGIRATSLTGQHSKEERKQSRIALELGKIDIIFTVDLFNEGVDIPKVDTLLFVRPTESISIFTQQIGRGLRLAPHKEKCVIIDFIGNYRNADRKLTALNPHANKATYQAMQTVPNTDIVLNLDLEVIDLLKEMIRKNQTYKQKILSIFKEIKLELGRRPTYLEFYFQSGYKELNVAKEFKTYVQLLKEANELSVLELDVFERIKPLLIEIEKTAMSKSYKMVLLDAMLQRGPADWYKSITASEASIYFSAYLKQPTKQTIDPIDFTPQKVIRLLEKMPMTKWAASSKGMASFDGQIFQFNVSIQPNEQELIYEWVKEICSFRLNRYFSKKAEKLN
ncbi:DEAD/DEAH box helicase family protein [Kurthia senegalensis]|uniref:DEAD/DEAH box helicase family protein n=1 Tax=Kurthia senegalensis TaxID=1033740 RepID=UPI0002881021|nr:DEAD/DEAH box helicase family protein [Kurthia senegalensis]